MLNYDNNKNTHLILHKRINRGFDYRFLYEFDTGRMCFKMLHTFGHYNIINVLMYIVGSFVTLWKFTRAFYQEEERDGLLDKKKGGEGKREFV